MTRRISFFIRVLALAVILGVPALQGASAPDCCPPWEGGEGCCVNACNDLCQVDQGGFVLDAVCGGPPYWCSLYCSCSCYRWDIGFFGDMTPTDPEDTPCALCDGHGGWHCPL